jgi:hypothetical protein
MDNKQRGSIGCIAAHFQLFDSGAACNSEAYLTG